MSETDVFTIVDPQNGNLAFKIFSFTDGSQYDHIQRLNYHSIVILRQGTAVLKSDFSEYTVGESSLLYFAPYQPFMLDDAKDIQGTVINFHSDFFCIYKHHAEIACNGVLFNNVYQRPYIALTDDSLKEFTDLLDQMKREIQNKALAQQESLVSYLKILLIKATRIKNSQCPENEKETQPGSEHFVIRHLKDAVEKHYKTLHSPSDYANLLNVPVNTLARISKLHFNKTLTHLISERIVIEAKRELYLTSKAVKQIADELGFSDEYYFSRFFKNNADVSPRQFREAAGFARAEG